VAFLVIYIGEAPSVGTSWRVPNSLKDHVILTSPANEEERMAVAEAVRHEARDRGACARRSTSTMRPSAPTTGWPERLYLVDRDGRVAYRACRGRSDSSWGISTPPFDRWWSEITPRD
jgi:type I thyroxine 5'-deiodinase